MALNLPVPAHSWLDGEISINCRKVMRKNCGFTLIELTIVMVIIGVILGFAVPQYRETLEQSRVDLAATNLQAIWTAQRLYWTQNRTFATTLEDLENAGLFEPKFVDNINQPDSLFLYYIDSADASSFEAVALRRNSESWSGSLTINEQGDIDGQIYGSGGIVIQPTQV